MFAIRSLIVGLFAAAAVAGSAAIATATADGFPWDSPQASTSDTSSTVSGAHQ